jgi:hypothetical protein
VALRRARTIADTAPLPVGRLFRDKIPDLEKIVACNIATC